MIMKRFNNLKMNCGACLFAIVLLMTAAPVQAQEPEPPDLSGDEDFNKGGRTGFQFLKIGVGARQTAMAGAGMAAVRNVNSVFWNPANITAIESAATSFSYIRWLADMNYVAGAAGISWDGVGSFALSMASLNYGSIQEATVVPTGAGDRYRTGESVSGSDLLIGLTYSRMFTGRLSIGVGIKYLRESLWTYTASNYAFDIGTNYDIGFNGTRLAMSVQNYSPNTVQWIPDSLARANVEGYAVPLVFRVGVSTNFVGPQNAFLQLGPAHRALLVAEAINTNDFGERLHFGAEYQFAGFLALRGGYRLNYAEGNWTLGVGLHPEFAGMEVRIDYAYALYEFLGAPHRLTMSLAF